MVAYAPELDLSGILMFLSTLASHTRNLLGDPRAALVVSEPDPGTGDPQTLARVTVEGVVHEIARHDDRFGAAWQTYTSRFPDAAPRLALADFLLLRLEPRRARYVGGFARAATYTAEDLRGTAE
jgi:putative heme iron utilization protein